MGTIINCIAIIGGCIVGLIVGGRISEKISNTVMNALGLAVIYIGISGALEGGDTLKMIISMAIGAVIGEIIDIDRYLNKLGDFLQKKFKGSNNNSSISEGFVTASLLFCVGAMAVVGALENGLKGNYDTLLAKSVLDGVSSIIFSSTLGIGVMLSAGAVFIYQGVITLGAGFLSGILSDVVITNMSCVGSLLILGIGLNMLGITKIKVANLLPAIFIPIIFGVFSF